MFTFYVATDRIRRGETSLFSVRISFATYESIKVYLEHANKQTNKLTVIKEKKFLHLTFSGLLTKRVSGSLLPRCLLRQQLADQTQWRLCWKNTSRGLRINLHCIVAAAAERMILKTSAIFCHRWACNYVQ